MNRLINNKTPESNLNCDYFATVQYVQSLQCVHYSVDKGSGEGKVSVYFRNTIASDKAKSKIKMY